ncbi:MAG: glycosyltransferase family 2 protein [Bacteroidales bacterium]|nr:glycosyltransferase family 2 protein [Bacteroidales bacterium]
MAKISATILTFNESKRIEACVESLRDIADEIIVIDSYSTDDTVEICQRLGCKVRQRALGGYGAQRQYATSLATHSYVLSLDADEVLSPALRAKIMKMKQEGFQHRGYAFPRLNFYCGFAVKSCGWYPDLQVRLFDKRYANWDLRDLDERVIFRDNVQPVVIDGDILHYRCDTPEEYEETERKHAEILGHSLAKKGSSIGPLRPRLEGVKQFLKCYLGQGGIWDGMPGRAISAQRYRTTVLSYQTARRYLHQQQG